MFSSCRCEPPLGGGSAAFAVVVVVDPLRPGRAPLASSSCSPTSDASLGWSASYRRPPSALFMRVRARLSRRTADTSPEKAIGVPRGPNHIARPVTGLTVWKRTAVAVVRGPERKGLHALTPGANAGCWPGSCSCGVGGKAGSVVMGASGLPPGNSLSIRSPRRFPPAPMRRFPMVPPAPAAN